MNRRLLGAASALLIGIAAVAVAQDSKPLSPSGVRLAMVGGKWSAPDKDGEPQVRRREVDRGHVQPSDAARPHGHLRQGRRLRKGHQRRHAGVARGREPGDTKLTTEVPLMIGGKRVEPGSYDVFVELKEPAWTLVLSTQPTQEKYDANDKTKIWGAYGYDPKFDVVRVPMTMLTPKASIDQWTIGFVDMTDDGGKL
jgi:hypothetical protein